MNSLSEVAVLKSWPYVHSIITHHLTKHTSLRGYWGESGLCCLLKEKKTLENTKQFNEHCFSGILNNPCTVSRDNSKWTLQHDSSTKGVKSNDTKSRPKGNMVRMRLYYSNLELLSKYGNAFPKERISSFSKWIHSDLSVQMQTRTKVFFAHWTADTTMEFSLKKYAKKQKGLNW